MFSKTKTTPKNWPVFWDRLASFGHLDLISDPLMVLKFHNAIHDPKRQANKTFTIVKG